MSVFHDEVEIEDFEYDAETETYYYPCPCGDQFEITLVSLRPSQRGKKNVCLSNENAQKRTTTLVPVVTIILVWMD